jgi:glycosyltransferase involved in cell wall biosynthesis
MNILLLTQFFSPTRGGGEVMFYQLADQLARRGHKIFVIKHKMLVSDLSEDNISSLPSNVVVYEIDPAVEHRGGLPTGIFQNVLYILNSIKIGLKIIKTNQVDVIHCNAYSPIFAGWFLSKLTGVPLLVTIHDVASLYGYNFWKEWMRWFGGFSHLKAFVGHILELLIIKLGKNIHTVSDTSKRDLEALCTKCNKIVIPNALNLEYYNIEANNITYDNFILFIGRLVYYKNLDLVIEALKLLKRKRDTKLIVLGDGPMRSTWKSLVNRYHLDDNVEFKGVVSHGEKIHYLSKARAIVLPSIFEGFGIVVLEAWALKKPVIVADVEPLNKLVEDGLNGFVAKPNDPRKWAELISRLMSEEDLARKLGENGFQKLLREYTIQKTVKQFENVYIKLIRARYSNIKLWNKRK